MDKRGGIGADKRVDRGSQSGQKRGYRGGQKMKQQYIRREKLVYTINIIRTCGCINTLYTHTHTFTAYKTRAHYTVHN